MLPFALDEVAAALAAATVLAARFARVTRGVGILRRLVRGASSSEDGGLDIALQTVLYSFSALLRVFSPALISAFAPSNIPCQAIACADARLKRLSRSVFSRTLVLDVEGA